MNSRRGSWLVDVALYVSFIIAFCAMLSLLYFMFSGAAVGTVVSVALLAGSVGALVHIVTEYG